jgi:hypothetical protein
LAKFAATLQGCSLHKVLPKLFKELNFIKNSKDFLTKNLKRSCKKIERQNWPAPGVIDFPYLYIVKTLKKILLWKSKKMVQLRCLA